MTCALHLEGIPEIHKQRLALGEYWKLRNTVYCGIYDEIIYSWAVQSHLFSCSLHSKAEKWRLRIQHSWKGEWRPASQLMQDSRYGETFQASNFQYRKYLILLSGRSVAWGGGPEHRVNTEWQWPLSGVLYCTYHHDGKISPAWWDWGCAPFPFHSIYHHEQSCGVRSSWAGRYTPPISPLPLYILCGPDRLSDRGL